MYSTYNEMDFLSFFCIFRRNWRKKIGDIFIRPAELKNKKNPLVVLTLFNGSFFIRSDIFHIFVNEIKVIKCSLRWKFFARGHNTHNVYEVSLTFAEGGKKEELSY